MLSACVCLEGCCRSAPVALPAAAACPFRPASYLCLPAPATAPCRAAPYRAALCCRHACGPRPGAAGPVQRPLADGRHRHTRARHLHHADRRDGWAGERGARPGGPPVGRVLQLGCSGPNHLPRRCPAAHCPGQHQHAHCLGAIRSWPWRDNIRARIPGVLRARARPPTRRACYLLTHTPCLALQDALLITYKGDGTLVGHAAFGRPWSSTFGSTGAGVRVVRMPLWLHSPPMHADEPQHHDVHPQSDYWPRSNPQLCNLHGVACVMVQLPAAPQLNW